MTDTPRVTVPVEDLAGKLKSIRDKFLMPTPDKDFTDYAVMTRCIDALSAAPAPEGGAVSDALQRLRVLRDQARNGTAVSDPDEYDADELDAILSVIEPSIAPAEAGVAQRVMSRSDLTNATTPGHADAYLNALLDYTAGFYGEAREAGMPATSVADAMNHVERAARGLHALALRAQPPAREDAQPVGWISEAVLRRMGRMDHEMIYGDKKSADYQGDAVAIYTTPPAPEAENMRVAVEALKTSRENMIGWFEAIDAEVRVEHEMHVSLKDDLNVIDQALSALKRDALSAAPGEAGE